MDSENEKKMYILEVYDYEDSLRCGSVFKVLTTPA